jgi:hypothetical protein
MCQKWQEEFDDEELLELMLLLELLLLLLLGQMCAGPDRGWD